LFVAATVLYNQGVWARFYRTEGTTGFSYGYGYGYDAGWGYGYGYYSGEGKNNYGYLMSQKYATSTESPSQTSATIAVTTDYLALVKVQYGTVSGSYGFNTSYTASYATSTNVSLTGLSCSTVYYYRVVAKDIGGHEWTGSEASFNTSACSGGGGGGGAPSEPAPEVPTESTEATISAESGGSVTLTASDGTKVTVSMPAGAVDSDTTLSITRSDASAAVSAGSIEAAPGGLVMIGDMVFSFTATDAEGNPVLSFAEDITLTFNYTESQVEGYDEDSLTVYMWNGTEWEALESTVDPENNTISATTDHFTYFAIMGEEEEEEKPISEMTIEELKEKIAEIMALIADLKAKIQKLLFGAIPSGFTFERNLRYGMSSDDVKYLQIVLNSDEDTQLAESGVGSPGEETRYFGPLTKAAVIKFQEKYAEDVLGPWGLTKGTGFVGKTTRAKLNELLTGQ